MENWKENLELLRTEVCKAAACAGSTIRAGAVTAGRAAECALACAKWKKELMELEALHSCKLHQIGEMVYATHSGAPTDSDTLAAALQEVDTLRAQIADVKSAIAAIRGVIVCSGCGTTNPAENTYCTQCGTLLR